MATHGFELIKEQDIPEINTKAQWYRHTKSGAELLSLQNDDENKVFGITFRTPADDSTGIAHIMEHSVLCGSRKYPVKEPFVELIKGSLNTFLNAFTYPDRTCYPVASTNLKDFYNLVDVYLDAVFYPSLTPFTLQQEGWHYELENTNDPLIYKGVVFNEMKGNYSSPDRVLGEYSQQVVFPDNTYQHESGGHPENIPDLTWEQFKNFHENYYHPSNSRIYCYGDDPVEERLRLLNEYLQDFDKKDIDSTIALQSAFSDPKTIHKKYQAGEDDEQNKSMLTLNWLLPENGDIFTASALAVLGHVLLGTPAAPLYKALIDSGLGEDVTGTGMETELRQMYFSTGLKGIAEEDTAAVEKLILDTLESLAKNGIEADTIAASMNTVEFRLRENNTGSYPRGLVLMLRALATWIYDCDPLEALGFEKTLAELKTALAENPRFFEELIQQHVLDNPHRVTLILSPDAKLGKQEEQREKDRLTKAREAMNDTDVQAVIANTKELKARQERPDAPEDLAKLPTLLLSDIEKDSKKIPLEVLQKDQAEILYHDLFTNGIVYLAVGFDLHTLPQDLLPYLPLFSRVLLEIGTTEQNYVQLFQRIGRTTGGVSPTVYSASQNGKAEARVMLMLRGKALMPQLDDMLAIMDDIIRKVQFDNRERFLQMILDEKASLESSIIPSGHGYVNSRLKSHFSEAGWLNEKMSGISYLFFLRHLQQQAKNDWQSVLSKFEQIRKLAFNRKNLVCNVTIDRDNWQQFQPRLEKFITNLPFADTPQASWQREAGEPFEGLAMPAQVNYVGKGGNLYDLGYAFHGSSLVVQKYLKTTWLWDRVRVQGGAYGGFCTFDRRTGVFTYLSYRDPNVLKTIENYDNAAHFLKNVSLSREEIVKSVIGTIGDIDGYQLPDAKGYTSMGRYLAGESDADIQQLRDQVLATSEADFRAFAEALDAVREKGIVSVLGSHDAIAEANKANGGWLKVTKVL